MISFDRIRIDNFRTYDDIDISFTHKNGVILMSGDNGAGKSTLLNAICWCLYADTPFFAIEDSKEITNKFAPEDSKVKVELTATIDDKKYVFSRIAESGSRGGIQKVHYEENGNWQVLEGASVNDAVKRLLPKDLRHLFFFNGEQIKEIFKPGNHDGLKVSVHKVSEIELIEKAKQHLATVEQNYLKEINKKNKNTKEIEKLQNLIVKREHEIETVKKAIDIFDTKINIRKDKLAELNKIIENTAGAREMLKQKEILDRDLERAEEILDKCEWDKRDIVKENFHRALLKNEFIEYKSVLSKAEEDGLIPPPVKPEVTRRILETGTCICGQAVGDEQRNYIQAQHDEYERKQELQYLTEGIYTQHAVAENLANDRYRLKDTLSAENQVASEKSRLQEEIGKINDNLDVVNLQHDDPEARRNDLQNEINQHIAAQGRSKNQLETLNREQVDDLKDLDAIIQKDTATEMLDKKRKYTQILAGWLSDVGDNMEIAIRKKLTQSAKETFFDILPDTDFIDINIDKDYVVTLKSDKNVTYSTSNLSTGQAKALGLSLAYGLSKDLGYSTTPLLIDNLYGDIGEAHHIEVTRMISALSAEKQIVIMDLSAHKTQQMFEPNVIKQVFRITKPEGEHCATIQEEHL